MTQLESVSRQISTKPTENMLMKQGSFYMAAIIKGFFV